MPFARLQESCCAPPDSGWPSRLPIASGPFSSMPVAVGLKRRSWRSKREAYRDRFCFSMESPRTRRSCRTWRGVLPNRAFACTFRIYRVMDARRARSLPGVRNSAQRHFSAHCSRAARSMLTARFSLGTPWAAPSPSALRPAFRSPAWSPSRPRLCGRHTG